MASTKDFISEKPKGKPIIYAYRDKNMLDILKVGFTTRTAEERIAEQYPTLRPGDKPYSIELVESAMDENGESFMDHDVFKVLERLGFSRLSTSDGKDTEWFKCDANDVKTAVVALLTHSDVLENRSLDFKMRKEQEDAVNKTVDYYERTTKEG